MSTEISQRPNPGPLRRVLFIEENVSYFEMLRKVLSAWSRESWQFYYAPTPGKALRVLEEELIDLVVMDQRLTTMDGFQFLKILKQRYPSLRKAVLTAEPNEDKKAVLLGAGIDVYLEKPSSIDGMESVYSTLNELAKWRSDEGFRGIVHGMALNTILRMICFGGHSVVLAVNAGSTHGTVYVQEGIVIHAEAGGYVGDTAVGLLLASRNGSFDIRPLTVGSLEATTNLAWDALDGLPLPEPPAVGAAASEPRAVHRSEQVAGDIVEAVKPIAVAPESHIEELVVCSPAGNLLYQSRAADPESRCRLISALVQQSNALNNLVPVGRLDRLEIETDQARFVMQANANALVFLHARRLEEN